MFLRRIIYQGKRDNVPQTLPLLDINMKILFISYPFFENFEKRLYERGKCIYENTKE